VIGAAFLICACATTPQRTAPPAATPPAGSPTELAPGRGRDILQVSCTACHDLREVTKLRGYYDRRQWRDTIVTMVEYGAELKPEEVDTLAEYLAVQLGRR
jgi:mono/diheme cytochrome c family protein